MQNEQTLPEGTDPQTTDDQLDKATKLEGAGPFMLALTNVARRILGTKRSEDVVLHVLQRHHFRNPAEPVYCGVAGTLLVVKGLASKVGRNEVGLRRDCESLMVG